MKFNNHAFDTFMFMAKTFYFRKSPYEDAWQSPERGYKELYLNYTKKYYIRSLVPWMRLKGHMKDRHPDFSRRNNLYIKTK